MAILCEVSLNKDTEREREINIGNSSSRTTGTSYKYEVYIFAEVVGNKCRLYKHFVVAAKK